MEDGFHGRNSMLEHGQSLRSLPTEEDGVAETTPDEDTKTLIPSSSAPLGRRR